MADLYGGEGIVVYPAARYDNSAGGCCSDLHPTRSHVAALALEVLLCSQRTFFRRSFLFFATPTISSIVFDHNLWFDSFSKCSLFSLLPLLISMSRFKLTNHVSARCVYEPRILSSHNKLAKCNRHPIIRAATPDSHKRRLDWLLRTCEWEIGDSLIE